MFAFRSQRRRLRDDGMHARNSVHHSAAANNAKPSSSAVARVSVSSFIECHTKLFSNVNFPTKTKKQLLSMRMRGALTFDGPMRGHKKRALKSREREREGERAAGCSRTI